MKRLREIILPALLILSGSLYASEGQQEDRLTLLSSDALSSGEWQEKSFEGSTIYRAIDSDVAAVVEASAQGTASGLFLEKEINIKEFPILHWSWKVSEGLEPHEETVKAGDDYAARIYVVVSGGLFFWKTIAINYVWSSNPSSDQAWDNAYAGDNAQMLALRGDGDDLERWYRESRNLQADFKALFGRDIDVIDGIALMTDTDDTGASAVAQYGEIYLTRN